MEFVVYFCLTISVTRIVFVTLDIQLHYVSISSTAYCRKYTNISDPWRNVGFCSNSCDKSDSLMDGWYRFTGIGGDQVISSCAQALSNTPGNVTAINYNLFTCNSSINSTDYITCSGGYSVYNLRPSKGSYATRENNLLL